MSYLAPTPWVLADVMDLSGALTGTFSSAGDSQRDYPVNGNLDRGYKLCWDLTGTAAGGLAGDILLNGVVANQLTDGTRGINAATVPWSRNAIGIYALATAVGAITPNGCGELIMETAITGQNRQARQLLTYFGNGAGDRAIAIGEGRFLDNATNITSIVFSAIAGTITGRIWLYVKNPQRRG